jgi:glycerol kinase
LKFIAAIDQGTTSTRCLIFDKEAHIISQAQKEHEQIYPKPGWVEHDPMEILANTKDVLLHALDRGSLSSNDISAIGITNQRETTVVWNRNTGLPYYNALVWQDTRTDQICKDLTEKSYDQLFRSKNGLPIATYFSGPKIKWLIDNIPTIKNDLPRGEVCFGNVDSWLIWNLTGGVDGGRFVTDVTNASRTMLFNLEVLNWDEELLNLFGLSSECLPEILPSSALFGEMTDSLKGVPITGVLGDQQAALFGQTCFEPGDAKNTYGTGCFMLLNTGKEIVLSKNGLLTTVGYQIGEDKPSYCLEGSIAVTGALVQWYRDNLGIISSAGEIEDLAGTVDDNGDVFFVPAFSGLYAPHWDASARGLIIGLTRFANKGHIARAILEATAYQTYEILEAMQKDAGINLNLLKVDGGMVKNELLMQFQADIIGKEVVRPVVTETTAMGAAYAAGLHIGFWRSVEELKQNWQVDKTWKPMMTDEERQILLSKWQKAINRSSGWV